MTDDMTILVCLFHHADQAHAATTELTRAGVPASAISLINASPGMGEFKRTSLAEIGVPERDLDHLREGIRGGGVVVSVAASADHVHTVEQTFERNQARVIDEAAVDNQQLMAAPAFPVGPTAEAAIPIIEEEVIVGKRTMDRGGARIYSHVTERPVDASVILREERINVERRPVSRPATAADFAAGSGAVVEMTATGEEAVIGKSSRVVEEVLVGKESSEHTEAVHDTVRKTEVEVEKVPSSVPGKMIHKDAY